MALSPLADEFLRLLQGELANEDTSTFHGGIPDEHIKTYFGERYEQLASAINELLQLNRLQLFTQGTLLVYKAIKEETAQKFEGLGYIPWVFNYLFYYY
jgi:hypothetical protein